MASEREVRGNFKQPATEAQGMNLSTKVKNKTHGLNTKAPCGGAATGTQTQGHEVQRGSCSRLSCPIVNTPVSWLAGCWLASWRAGCLAGSLVGWLFGWLAGQLVGFFSPEKNATTAALGTSKI